MKNKLIFIGIIFLFLLCISVTFAEDNDKHTDMFGKMKTRDYGEFTMDTPSKITFKESSDGAYGGHIFYNKDYMCVYIDFKDKIDADTIYRYHTGEATVIYPNSVSYDDMSSECIFYKEKHSPFLNNYIASYENDDYIIMITYDYIDDLVDMTRTIKIK